MLLIGPVLLPCHYCRRLLSSIVRPASTDILGVTFDMDGLRDSIEDWTEDTLPSEESDYYEFKSSLIPIDKLKEKISIAASALACMRPPASAEGHKRKE